MSDDREFIPDPSCLGMWIPNPAFTGNKYKLFQAYPCEIIAQVPFRPAHDGPYAIGSKAWVVRFPDGQLNLNTTGGPNCDAGPVEEGVHFKLL